jgi:hypothetical protein
MANDFDYSGRFVGWWIVSRELGVDDKFIKDEAAAGRIPYLQVGRRKMFLVSQVLEALKACAAANVKPTTQTEAER